MGADVGDAALHPLDILEVKQNDLNNRLNLYGHISSLAQDARSKFDDAAYRNWIDKAYGIMGNSNLMTNDKDEIIGFGNVIGGNMTPEQAWKSSHVLNLYAPRTSDEIAKQKAKSEGKTVAVVPDMPTIPTENYEPTLNSVVDKSLNPSYFNSVTGQQTVNPVIDTPPPPPDTYWNSVTNQQTPLPPTMSLQNLGKYTKKTLPKGLYRHIHKVGDIIWGVK
jgi:hypothetical protein